MAEEIDGNAMKKPSKPVSIPTTASTVSGY